MERVQNDGNWSLFCPNESPGLADCWGENFEELYTRYEREVYQNFLWQDIGNFICAHFILARVVK